MAEEVEDKQTGGGEGERGEFCEAELRELWVAVLYSGARWAPSQL